MENQAQERYRRNVARVADNTLTQLREDKNASQGLRHFWDILDDTFVKQIHTGGACIGSYCVMVPDELIYALGFRPLRLCAGHSIAALMGDELIPRDACPVVKASIGFHAMRTLPIYEQCGLAVLPMTCDAKRKCASLLTEYLTVMTGGGANNEALRMALEDELLCDVHTARYPQFNGAIGAALAGCIDLNREISA